MNRLRWILVGVVVAVMTAAGGGLLVLQLRTANTEECTVFIPRHASVVASIDSVHRVCSLPTPLIVSIVARTMARLDDRTVQAGWYKFPPQTTQWDVLIGLFSGSRRPALRVTIPEGLTYREIAGLLSRRLEVDSTAFTQWCEDPSVITLYVPVSGQNPVSMEGFLMPDTYDLFWRMSASDVGDRLAREWRKRHRDSMPSYEDVILASIVQAEAANVQEMPRIAGVYHNRLRQGMNLAADPTVQYGLGDRRRLTYRDLATDTPWNTYRRAGLPPTPINNPGMDAVRAAQHPERHTFLFFVARGDASGNHRFASTGQQHMENVRAYRSARAQSK